MIVNSQFIVLDKRPYRETGMLLYGISPDYGKLSLISHGAQKISPKNFPVADLFRELNVEFTDDEKGRELFTAGKIELETAFDGIANNPEHFKLAGKISLFLLKNGVPNEPAPYTYDSLKSIFTQLSGDYPLEAVWSIEQCSVLIKTVFLYESGMLPDGGGERQNEFIENLVASGIDNSALPECAPEYWGKLNQWLNSLIKFHQLKY